MCLKSVANHCSVERQCTDDGIMAYEAFREKPYPARYGSLKTPVRVDVTYAGIIFAIAILAFSFLVVIPGVRTLKKVSRHLNT